MPSRPGLRVTFDTNVYIAAVLRHNLADELVKRGIDGAFTIVTSQFILDELKEKLETKFATPAPYVKDLLATIRSGALLVAPTNIPRVVSDPDDNHILACAEKGRANLIITLDKDLLQLESWNGIAIMHPKTFTWIIPTPS